MSQPPPNTSLSLSARLALYLGPPSVILLTSLASPKTGLLSPLAFLPTISAYHACISLIQLGICKTISALLFSRDPAGLDDFWVEFARSGVEGLTTKELLKRAEIAWGWRNGVVNAALTFLAAGLGEEVLKYLPIAYARRHGRAEGRTRAYLDYALAGALSFSLIENIGFLYAAVEKGGSWSGLALSVFERVVVAGTGHVTMSVLTALRATRRDYYGDRLGWWEVIGPAALYHGAFDFVCFSASSWEGNVGWIHPTGLGVTSVMFGSCLSLVASAMWQTRREWKGLEDRDQVGKNEDDDGKRGKR
ncbi:hypothetical protein F5882DRAFT_520974 [Hyaloscypha sp. PMI_1271]|nr:hypothetical protein F5882DRAFT_520974 [Hyaloscypha sp. PMI_1271]